jgi:hypothetical protein
VTALNNTVAINTTRLHKFATGDRKLGGISGMNRFAGRAGRQRLSSNLKETGYRTRWEAGLAEDDFDILRIPIYQLKLKITGTNRPFAQSAGRRSGKK